MGALTQDSRCTVQNDKCCEALGRGPGAARGAAVPGCSAVVGPWGPLCRCCQCSFPAVCHRNSPGSHGFPGDFQDFQLFFFFFFPCKFPLSKLECRRAHLQTTLYASYTKIQLYIHVMLKYKGKFIRLKY